MEFTIFNVEHGFCGYLISDTNQVALLDCGHGKEFVPSRDLPKAGCNGIEKFFLSNFDQDHVSDLPKLREKLPIQVFHRNRSIPDDKLKTIKLDAGPLTPQMKEALKLNSDYIHEVSDPPDFGAVEFSTYRNKYPDFEDTNNLSLVTVISYKGLSIIYPGDIEKNGWETLLENRSLRQDLEDVNIFIASHHGRENGYNEKIFDFCTPDICVISDKEKVHETQKDLYAKHANGVKWDNGDTRYVLTTRSDGHLHISSQGSGYRITSNYNF